LGGVSSFREGPESYTSANEHGFWWSLHVEVAES
jgi:hypothetical protein